MSAISFNAMKSTMGPVISSKDALAEPRKPVFVVAAPLGYTQQVTFFDPLEDMSKQVLLLGWTAATGVPDLAVSWIGVWPLFEGGAQW